MLRRREISDLLKPERCSLQRVAELIQLPLQLLDRTRNEGCAFAVQSQPISTTDSTYQCDSDGVTHACRKLTQIQLNAILTAAP